MKESFSLLNSRGLESADVHTIDDFDIRGIEIQAILNCKVSSSHLCKYIIFSMLQPKKNCYFHCSRDKT